jgi:hypothetical protein
LARFAQWLHADNPTEGAVSPTLGDFFRACDPQTHTIIHWARWLRLDHETDEGIVIIPSPLAEDVVEAMIVQVTTDPTIADAMRRAVRGEHIGERDPNQRDLF